jgi:N-acylglucosamine 2-epimerase
MKPLLLHAPQQLAETYRSTLLNDVVPFWLRHGMDREFGGVLTCLDRDGTVIDTDKSVWFQGRAGWVFATLYNTVEKRPEWLERRVRVGIFHGGTVLHRMAKCILP